MNLKQEADQFLEERYGMSDFNSYQRSAAGTAIYPDQQTLNKLFVAEIANPRVDRTMTRQWINIKTGK